jgi:methyl-accepting chemotaxis protein
MSIPQLKIGQRLTLGFASVLALLAVMAAVAWNGLESSNAATQRIERMERRAAINAEWLASTRLNVNRALAVAKSRADPEVDNSSSP